MFNIKESVKDLNFHSVKETFLMALNSYQVTVHGTAGLLCSNVQNSDPLCEGAKQKAFFSSKKKKNDEDHLCLRALDWVFSGYWKKEGKVKVNELKTLSNLMDFLIHICQVLTSCVVLETLQQNGS